MVKRDTEQWPTQEKNLSNFAKTSIFSDGKGKTNALCNAKNRTLLEPPVTANTIP